MKKKGKQLQNKLPNMVQINTPKKNLKKKFLRRSKKRNKFTAKTIKQENKLKVLSYPPKPGKPQNSAYSHELRASEEQFSPKMQWCSIIRICKHPCLTSHKQNPTYAFWVQEKNELEEPQRNPSKSIILKIQGLASQGLQPMLLDCEVLRQSS